MTDLDSFPRRLLLIDDDSAYRVTLAWLLQKLGHTVEVAESGSAGLALLRQRRVDLVMTDLNMPGLTGWAVAQLVKAMHPHLPVVLVTGDAQAIAPEQPGRAWVDAILAKPCGLAEIQTVIGPLTRGRAESRAVAPVPGVTGVRSAVEAPSTPRSGGRSAGRTGPSLQPRSAHPEPSMATVAEHTD